MKKIALFILFLSMTIIVFSKDYFIGDEIKFSIDSNKEQKEIENAFNEFEIEKIEKSKTGYIVTVRAYTVGKKQVIIDKNKFEMEIKSSLSQKAEEINEFYGDKKNSKINMENEKINAIPYTYLSLFVLILLIIGTAIIIVKVVFIKKKTPYLILEKELKEAKEKDYFRYSTYVFKVYLEKIANIKIVDKTTKESKIELEKWILSESEIANITEIMEIADSHKFMKIEYDEKNIENHYNKILQEAKKIEEKLKKISKGDGK